MSGDLVAQTQAAVGVQTHTLNPGQETTTTYTRADLGIDTAVTAATPTAAGTPTCSTAPNPTNTPPKP
jgi:hypothetical protein